MAATTYTVVESIHQRPWRVRLGCEGLTAEEAREERDIARARGIRAQAVAGHLAERAAKDWTDMDVQAANPPPVTFRPSFRPAAWPHGTPEGRLASAREAACFGDTNV